MLLLQSFLDSLHQFSFHLFEKNWALVTIISMALILELVTREMKRRFKTRIYAAYDETDDRKDSEFHLHYYKKIQGIDVVRVSSFTIVLIAILILKAGLNINFLAVAAGALIIAFKDFWLSVVSFFFVVPQYHIGDIIRIGEAQGQIIYIRMFSVGLVGKDANGENNGQLFIIPNYKFLSESIRKEELGSEDILRDTIALPYKQEWFEEGFDNFVESLRVHLDTLFPLGNTRNVGNYKSYIGFRYKINYEYKEDKCLMIAISFVGKRDKNRKNRERIISWIEKKRIGDQITNNQDGIIPIIMPIKETQSIS